MHCSWERDTRWCLGEGKLLNQCAQPSPPPHPGKALLGLLLQPGGDENKHQVPLLDCTLRWGANLFFTQGEGRHVSRGQAREVA